MKKLLVLFAVIGALSLAGCDLLNPPAPPAETYTVTYNLNGGTGTLPTNTAEYEEGDTVSTAAGTGLSKTEFAFAGWNTAANGSGTPVAAGAAFTMGAADTTLYAQWTDRIIGTWTVAAVQAGGMASVNDVTTITATNFSTTRTITWASTALGGTIGATLTGDNLSTLATLAGQPPANVLALYGFPGATTGLLSGVVQSGTYVRTLGSAQFAITQNSPITSAAITAAAATATTNQVIGSPAIDYTGYYTRAVTFSTLALDGIVSASNPKAQNWVTHFSADGNTLTAYDGGSVMPVTRVVE